MSALHPRVRMPLWVAVALPLAAYVYRSFTRGWEFGLDVPTDVVALVLYVAALVLVLVARRTVATGESERTLEGEDDPEGDGSTH